VVLLSSLSGTFIGNLIAPRVRRLVPEERMLMGALLAVAFVGLVAARFGTRASTAVLAGTIGIAAAAAKVAFDSIVQRDAPEAARGQTFARFETRFQLMWVLGAAVPVFITPLPRHLDVGMGVLAFVAAFAAFSYAVGRRAVAAHRPDEPRGDG
jgi:predicted branched-subunit amino acid permease